MLSHNVLDTEVMCTAWTYIRAQQFTGLSTSEEYREEQQGEQHEVLVQIYVHARHFYGNRVVTLYNIDLIHLYTVKWLLCPLQFADNITPKASKCSSMPLRS